MKIPLTQCVASSGCPPNSLSKARAAFCQRKARSKTTMKTMAIRIRLRAALDGLVSDITVWAGNLRGPHDVGNPDQRQRGIRSASIQVLRKCDPGAATDPPRKPFF